MDEILALLNQQAFGGYTWMQVGIGMVVISVIWRVFAWIANSRKTDPNTVAAKCPGCGWRGRVSRFKRQCPMCGTRIDS